MRIIKECVLLNNASAGESGRAVANVNCDILSLAVLGESEGSYKVILEGNIKKGDDYVPIAVFPLTTYKLINGNDGITENGIYETGIEGLHSIRVTVDSESTANVSVYARFINSSI